MCAQIELDRDFWSKDLKFNLTELNNNVERIERSSMLSTDKELGVLFNNVHYLRFQIDNFEIY